MATDGRNSVAQTMDIDFANEQLSKWINEIKHCDINSNM